MRAADLVIGAVLVPGARAPKLVSRALVSQMKPGAVIVDVAVDQGGCFETTRPTTHSDPMYVVDGVLHYCVANMPGIVPAHVDSRVDRMRHCPICCILASAGVDAEPFVRCWAGQRGESVGRKSHLPGSGRRSRLAFRPLCCKTIHSSLASVRSCRGVAQPGSALRSGRRGRRFKSSRPDQTKLVRAGEASLH